MRLLLFVVVGLLWAAPDSAEDEKPAPRNACSEGVQEWPSDTVRLPMSPSAGSAVACFANPLIAAGSGKRLVCWVTDADEACKDIAAKSGSFTVAGVDDAGKLQSDPKKLLESPRWLLTFGSTAKRFESARLRYQWEKDGATVGKTVSVLSPVALPTDSDCPIGGTLRRLSGLAISADNAIGSGEVCVSNPFFAEPRSFLFCWQGADTVEGRCEANHLTRSPFSIDGALKPLRNSLDENKVLSVAQYPVFVVRVDPNITDRVNVRLRFEAQGRQRAEVFAISAEPVAEDSRFKLDVLAGFSLLHSQQNFSQAFPEALIDAQSRFWDSCLVKERPDPNDVRGAAAKGCNPRGKRWLVRGYARAGLTSTVARSSGPGDPLQSLSFTGTKSFEGSAALGLGLSWPLTTLRTHDTNRFSTLAVYRFGTQSLETVNELGDTMPDNYMIGLRVENESGRFEGGYVEIGLGRSEQFVAKVKWRFKFQALLPFKDSGFALRLTIDQPWRPEKTLEEIEDITADAADGTGTTVIGHRIARSSITRLCGEGETPDLCRTAINSFVRAGEIRISFIYRVSIDRLIRGK